MDEVRDILNLNSPGLVVTPYNARFYLDQGIAPQVVGYASLIPKEELDQYRRQGYRGDEKVGLSGIEKSMEPYLAGKHGGALYVVDPNGQIVTRIAASEPEPAASVYLTIDRNLQHYGQLIFGDFQGAAVVLELNTGRVLAMVSSPEYDQNLFDANNLQQLYPAGGDDQQPQPAPGQPRRARGLSSGIGFQAHHHGRRSGERPLSAHHHLRLSVRFHRVAAVRRPRAARLDLGALSEPGAGRQLLRHK